MSVLKQARIDANLSIEDVSRQLNIRKHYIIALEEDNFDEIPGAVYVQGYRKIYANFFRIEHLDEGLANAEVVSNNTYTKVMDGLGGKNNLGIATVIIFALILGVWFYMLFSSNNHGNDLVKELENQEPTNYMLNIQEPMQDAEDTIKVDFKLPNIERSNGVNNTNNQ